MLIVHILGAHNLSGYLPLNGQEWFSGSRGMKFSTDSLVSHEKTEILS